MFLQTTYCMYILLCYKLKFIVSLYKKKIFSNNSVVKVDINHIYTLNIIDIYLKQLIYRKK